MVSVQRFKLFSKILTCALLMITCYGCAELNSYPPSDVDEKVLDTKILVPPPYPEYELAEKDTFYNEWENGASTEEIEIGVYHTDSVAYNVVIEFGLLPVANGFRGKNKLYLITPDHQQFAYEASSKREIPVDVFDNKLVFQEVIDSFIFTEITLIDTQHICFGDNWRGCLF